MKPTPRARLAHLIICVGLCAALPALAQHGPGGPPPRGAVVDRMPPGHRAYFWHGEPYHYFDGLWYRPLGSRFVVVLPPVGLVVPVLPDGVLTVTLGGVPYYSYGGAYYLRAPGGYRVVEAPAEAPTPEPAPAADLFVYPRDGQDAKTQSRDRFECHEWASGQTGYDPTRSGGGVDQAQRSAVRADYQRAMTACLDARGYSVR